MINIDDIVILGLSHIEDIENRLSKLNKGSVEWHYLSTELDSGKRLISKYKSKVRDEKLKIILDQ